VSLPFELSLQPMEHQERALAFAESKSFYALLMEQGTGKTPVIIWDSCRRHVRGALDGMLVMAPNGVHSNWTLREIPKHAPRSVQVQTAAYYSGANKRQQARIDDLFAPAGDRLRILTMNWEALTTENGYELAVEFLRMIKAPRAGIAGDESQRIKSYQKPRAKAFHRLKKMAQAFKAITTGTPILKSPWDAFSQFTALHEFIFGTSSFVAFKAEYAELLPAGHGLLRHITDRLRPQIEPRFAHIKRAVEHLPEDDERRRLEINRYETLVQEELNKRAPQLVAKDPITGLPKWRNLEKLNALIAPHSFQARKADCLDLPEKVYVTRWFSMTPKQASVQEKLKSELRLVLEDGSISPVDRLAAFTKLAQVSSGYFLIPGTDIQQRIMPLERNPKMAVLMAEVETCLENGESILIWARHQAELRDIAQCLTELKTKQDNVWDFVEYHGEIGSKTARQEAIDAFEAGRARIFLSQQQAGGTGLTLIAAASLATQMSVIYYSNTFALEDRLQSEDRAHRIGQSKTVRYVDILGEETIDPMILQNLQSKVDMAAMVMGHEAAQNLASSLLKNL
jgi:SNF2 family DNA or RNA helicase